MGKRCSRDTVSRRRSADVDWSALWLSVRLASATTLVLLVIGIPIAYWIVYAPHRGKFLVEAVVALPLVLPPTVLGFYVLIAIGPMSPVGRAYTRVAGHGLPFTFEGLLLASVLYSLPFAVQPFSTEFASVDRRLIEASWSLGVSPLATFRRVVLPLSIRGIVTGVVLSFAHTLGEFGVVLMVGGNLPGVTRTVSISIYDAVQSLDYHAASRTSLFLLVTSFVILACTYSLQRSAWVAPHR
jgi:molybdate transport system permease protein